jgi:hypothetical protein
MIILLIKHAANEGPGLIKDFLEADGFDIREIELSRGESLPRSVRGIDAAISIEKADLEFCRDHP